MSAAPFRLGLTATLERSDARHTKLADWIGPTVYELPLARVKGSTLADYHIFRIPSSCNRMNRRVTTNWRNEFKPSWQNAVRTILPLRGRIFVPCRAITHWHGPRNGNFA